LEAGVADEMAEPGQLRELALTLLAKAASGELDWKARRAHKQAPLAQSAAERESVCVAAMNTAAEESASDQRGIAVRLRYSRLPSELDSELALLLGIGFPAYLGGPLKYADWIGLARLNERIARYAYLGKDYAATPRMIKMASMGLQYHD